MNTQLEVARVAADKQVKVKATWSMLDEAFGDHDVASKAVTAYMGDDPVKKEIVNSMAVSDPAGLMKLLGKDVAQKVTTFTGTHNSNQDNQVDLGNKLTWASAQQIRRDNPVLYYTHAFRQRMQTELPQN